MTDAAPLVRPVGSRYLHAPAPGRGALVDAIENEDQPLVYFLLNVGDGDTQLMLLPPDGDGVRRLIIVDVATRRKLPDLLVALHECGLIEQLGAPEQVSLMVATHPHFDHIGGLPDLLIRCGQHDGWIDQFWDPGYYFPGPSFINVMRLLEEHHPSTRRLQPTSGTTLYLDAVKITVIGPGVGLRSRFDTYGVGVNDASITLMIEYPAVSLFTEEDHARGVRKHPRMNRRTLRSVGHRLLLGADAQFASWAQATVDFPDLVQLENPVLAKELRAAMGRDYLGADVFKLSHHASKHGINVEVLERVGAELTLISCTPGGGRHGFPHMLAMEAAREARKATARSGDQRPGDEELGIHLTGAWLEGDGAAAAGSIAIVVPRKRGALRMFRLMDGRKESIDLSAAREVRLRGVADTDDS